MKRLLPVACVFAVLLALVVAKESRRARLDEGADASDTIVTIAPAPFRPADVARIEVTAPGGAAPLYAVERKADDWTFTAPFPAPGHVNKIEDLCKALASADAEIRADDAGALRDFDLVPERATQVKAVDAAGKVLAHVAIGRSTGTSSVFVRRMDDASDVRVLVAAQDFRRLLGLGRTGPSGDAEPEEPKASFLRDLSFPPLKLEEPTRLTITTPGRKVAFEKKAGKWEAAEGGPGAAVNATGVEQVLAHLGPDFQAKDLADPRDLAELGLADPKWALEVTLKDGRTVRVVGAREAEGDRSYVRVASDQEPGVVYEAASWDWARLFPAGSALFTLDPVEVKDDQCTRVVVERTDGSQPTIELTRDGTKPGDDWKVVSPDWGLVPRQGSLRNLTSAVRNVRPTDWVDGADLGPAEIVVRAGARDAADDAMTTIRIGGKAPGGTDRLASLPKPADRVMVVGQSVADRLAPDALSLFEPRVLQGWTEPDVQAVRVETSADGAAWTASFAIEREGAGWALVRGEERGPAAAAAVKTWLDALLALEPHEPSKAPQAATARVTLVKKDGTEKTLALSADKAGTRTVSIHSLAFDTERAGLLPDAETLVAPAARVEEPGEPKDDPPK